MQLAMARYISSSTPIKVIFNGDVIDEASGSYVYFKMRHRTSIPRESVRLMKEIHLYDVLRADRRSAVAVLKLGCHSQTLISSSSTWRFRLRLGSPERALKNIYCEKHLMAFYPMKFSGDPKKRSVTAVHLRKIAGLTLSTNMLSQNIQRSN